MTTIIERSMREHRAATVDVPWPPERRNAGMVRRSQAGAQRQRLRLAHVEDAHGALGAAGSIENTHGNLARIKAFRQGQFALQVGIFG